MEGSASPPPPPPCFDIEFPIPRDCALWSAGQRWFDAQRERLGDAAFTVHHHHQDWVVSGEAWLFTERDAVEHLHGASLRFGGYSGVVLGSVCLVAAFPSLADEYDDWEKNPLEGAVACSASQTIHGTLAMGQTCVFRVYPFQLERLRRLMQLDLVPRLDELVGAHMRRCIALSK